MNLTLRLIVPLLLLAPAVGAAQAVPPANERTTPVERAVQTERDGVEVRIKDIARFRGVRGNTVTGYGLVIGLARTGDSRSAPFTATMLSNLLKSNGTMIEAREIASRNIAAVIVTAELPPFATPGNLVDVTISSIGDATSLEGGTLLQTPLFSRADPARAAVVASGPITIGGFNASGGGSRSAKNHATVGRIPEGGSVERVPQTQIVFDGRLFIELDQADITTAQRIVERLNEGMPEMLPQAIDGGTIQVTVPTGMTVIDAMSRIEATTVRADVPAVVVINERTGTIVIGGNVRLGPAVVVHGSLRIQIQQDLVVSQPPALSGGQTVAGTQTNVQTEEETAQVALIPPNTTVNDLARILQSLKLSARDINSILQSLQTQGALKARIRMQ